MRELANKDLEGAFLHTAAHFGQAEVIKILAKKSKRGLKFDERVGLLEHIPLHVAVTGGHERVVMLLVALGADVNVRKSTNITPLHEAAKKKGEMVELLLRLGAHVDARANNNVTPLHLAVTSGDCMAVKALLEYGGKLSSPLSFSPFLVLFHFCIFYFDIFYLYYSIQANVNAKNDHGFMPLHIAVAYWLMLVRGIFSPLFPSPSHSFLPFFF